MKSQNNVIEKEIQKMSETFGFSKSEIEIKITENFLKVMEEGKLSFKETEQKAIHLTFNQLMGL